MNTYAHGTTSVMLGATKVLSGKALADGQFTFAVTAEDGTVYQAKNDAAGSVAFPALTFAEPGTYVYTISEVNDKQANVTYDTATYQVVVNVVDDGQGNLVATVAYDDGAAPTFKNSYPSRLLLRPRRAVAQRRRRIRLRSCSRRRPTMLD